MQKRQTRRQFLESAGLGAVGAVAAGGFVRGLKPVFSAPEARAATTTLALAATDGYITVPNRNTGDPAKDPIYIFGFIPVDPNASVANLISAFKTGWSRSPRVAASDSLASVVGAYASVVGCRGGPGRATYGGRRPCSSLRR